jgi:ankyrin repeat protein
MRKLLLLLFGLMLIAACTSVQPASTSTPLPPNPKREFGDAAQNGDVEKLNELIASGVDVDSLFYPDHTPLMFAVYYGHYEVAKLLIDEGANVNAAHSNDHTVLYHALEASQLHAELIQLLVDAGVNMDYTPLKWAIQYQYSNSEVQEIMAILIEAGADVNERDQTGLTALIDAACRGSNQLVDILLRSGADINATVESSGHTALACAVAEEHSETVRLLIEAGTDLETIDESGNTPLMIAKSKRYEEIEKLLTDAGATR